MYLSNLVKVVEGKTNLDLNIKIKDIKTDSRKIEKGDVFVSLKGKNYDGHDFIFQAIEKGAIACIVDKDISNQKCIRVEDTYKTLFHIAKYQREQHNIPLIAITGSNGKTTTSHILTHILSSKYKVLNNKDSKNNLIGVSSALFKLDNTYDIAVIELGSNHMGEIKYLSDMCTPTLSLITNIGSSHLEYFNSRRNIFKEKLSILDGMRDKNLIINGDDKYLKKLNYYKCGLNKSNQLYAYDIIELEKCIEFKIYLDKEYKIIFNNPGKHFIIDILLAIKACLLYNIRIDDIISKISSFKMVDKRMNIINTENNIIINDCYNASYESVIAGLDYLKNIDKNKIIIIGDILELGKHSVRIHRKINKQLAKIKQKKVLTVGDYTKYIRGKHFNNNFELTSYLEKININNTYIYIKGSRGMNLDLIVDYLLRAR